MHRSRRRPRTRSRHKIAQLLHHPLLDDRIPQGILDHFSHFRHF